MSGCLVNFLLVEDNPDHTVLMRYGLERSRICNEILSAENGEEALRILRKEDEFSMAVTPDVVLLDLNMPKMGGLELLEILKNDSNLMHIPVVILTTSEAERDRLRAYELHVNSYLVKPFDFTDFKKMVADLGLYWGIWNRPAIGP